MRQSGANNGDLYQSSFTAQSQNMEAGGMGPKMTEENPLDRATEHVQALLRSRQDSRSSIDGQEHQGNQNVASDAVAGSKSLNNDQAQKMVSTQSSTGDQNMGGSAFFQGKNGFSQNAGDQIQEANGNGQGFQRQMILSVGQEQQQQQQQQKMANGGADLNHYQQPLTPNQQRLQMMKAAAASNSFQPFMMQQPASVGDKQTHLKA